MNNTNEHIIETQRMETMFAGANKSYTTFYHLNHEKPWFKQFQEIQQQKNIDVSLWNKLSIQQIECYEDIIRKYNISTPFMHLFICDYLYTDGLYNDLLVHLNNTIDKTDNNYDFHIILKTQLGIFIKTCPIDRLLILVQAAKELHCTDKIEESIHNMSDNICELIAWNYQSLKEHENKLKMFKEMNTEEIEPNVFKQAWKMFDKYTNITTYFPNL